jgi:hypothetical protein
MSLVVEDGSGKSNANSYCDVAFADAYVATYAANSDQVAWAALDQAGKEARLQKGTQYLEVVYKRRWVQRRNDDRQALSWPRSWVEDGDGFAVGSNVVPVVVKQATVEAALRAGSELVPDIATAPIVSESKTVGPISTSKTYMGGKPVTTRFRKIDLLIAEFLLPVGMIERC